MTAIWKLLFGKTHEQLVIEAERAKPKTETFGPAPVLNLVGNVRNSMSAAEGQFPSPQNLSPQIFMDGRLYKKLFKVTDRRRDPYAMDIDWDKFAKDD